MLNVQHQHDDGTCTTSSSSSAPTATTTTTTTAAASSYDACFRVLLRSGCVAGLALLDAAGGRTLYENRTDQHLLPRRRPLCPPKTRTSKNGDDDDDDDDGDGDGDGEKERRKDNNNNNNNNNNSYRYDVLVSPSEGQQLVAAVKGLTDDGLCRQEEVLTCMGMPFRVFGGTPLGIYAVGPGRRTGLIARALPRVGFMVVFYRRPHLPQQVVPCVENFVDRFWVEVQNFGPRLPASTTTGRTTTTATRESNQGGAAGGGGGGVRGGGGGGMVATTTAL